MIFVTGCARSGTSLTMAVLQACGANLGEVNRLNENTDIRNGLVKEYLKKIGADPRGQFPLPRYDEIVGDEGWRSKVERYLPPEPSATKIIKGVLFWPLWVEHFPEATWVVVRRSPDDIARSCLRSQFMVAYRTHEGWVFWANEYHDRCNHLMEKVGYRAIDVWPHDAIRGGVEAYKPMVEHCGLTWRPDRVRSVIDPNRWQA